MIRSWVTFYEGRVFNSDYLNYAEKRYLPFINKIRELIKPGDRVVEVGCGIATITKILSEFDVFTGYRCFDINPDMVELAVKNLEPKNYPVEVGDCRQPIMCLPDVIHSHGLLEHFSDDEIRIILKQFAESGARASVHYVPGCRYEKPSFGDERLLPLETWLSFEPNEALTFNDGHDYILVWKNYVTPERLKD